MALSLVLIAGMDAAFAQTAKETVLSYSYDMTLSRINPCCGVDTVHFDHTLTLKSDNTVVETARISYPNFQRDYPPYSGQLGKPSNLPDQIWHVMPDNTLLWGAEALHSLRTKTIKRSAAGGCTFSIKDRLKPGFSDYAYPNAKNGQVSYFSSVQYTNMVCRIR